MPHPFRQFFDSVGARAREAVGVQPRRQALRRLNNGDHASYEPLVQDTPLDTVVEGVATDDDTLVADVEAPREETVEPEVRAPPRGLRTLGKRVMAVNRTVPQQLLRQEAPQHRPDIDEKLASLLELAEQVVQADTREEAVDDFVQVCMPLRGEMVALAELEQRSWDRHLLRCLALAISLRVEHCDAGKVAEPCKEARRIVNYLHLNESGLGLRERRTLEELIDKYATERRGTKEQQLRDETYALHRHFSQKVRKLRSGLPFRHKFYFLVLRGAHCFIMMATFVFLLALLGGMLMQLFFDLLAHNMCDLDKWLVLFVLFFPCQIVLFALVLYEAYLMALASLKTPSLSKCRALMLVAMGSIPSDPCATKLKELGLVERNQCRQDRLLERSENDDGDAAMPTPDEHSEGTNGSAPRRRPKTGLLGKELEQPDGAEGQAAQKKVAVLWNMVNDRETLDGIELLKRDISLIDAWFTHGLAVCIAGVMVYTVVDGTNKGVGDGIVERLWSSAMLGGLLWGLLTVAIATCADMKVHRQGQTKNGRKAFEFLSILRMALDTDKIEPGEMSKSLPAIMYTLSEYKSVFGDSPRQDVDSSQTCLTEKGFIDWGGWINGALCLPLGLWWFVMTVLVLRPQLTRLAVTYFSVATLLLAVVFIMSYFLGKLVPAVRKCSAFHGFSGFFLTIGFCMLIGFSFAIGRGPSESDPQPDLAVMTVEGGAGPKNDWMSPSPYTACLMRWGAPGSRVSILDLAALAGYSYIGSEAQYDRLLELSFGNLAKRVYFDEGTVFPRMVATRIQARDAGGVNTVVVAVKGTSTAKDVYTDASLYAIIAVLQYMSFVMPLIDMMPNTFLAWLLYQLRLPDIWREEDRIFEHAEKAIRLVNTSNTNVVLTGHSLGGGITAALGARLKIPTVVFSAPGGHFSRKRFGFTREQSYRNVMNIVPDTDIVPKVDRHDATVQRIICQDKTGVVRAPWECHYMSNTICELYRACGDVRGRDFTNACSSRINFEERGEYVTKEEVSEP